MSSKKTQCTHIHLTADQSAKLLVDTEFLKDIKDQDAVMRWKNCWHVKKVVTQLKKYTYYDPGTMPECVVPLYTAPKR